MGAMPSPGRGESESLSDFAVEPDESIQKAIADWHYWAAQVYLF